MERAVKINAQYAEGLPRPDLKWADELLGESLHITSAGEANRPSVTAHLDVGWIPMGRYCYHPRPYDSGARPCPYFNRTDYGTTTCAFMNVEAYDDFVTDWATSPLALKFGNADGAEKAGVMDDLALPDALKICDVNKVDPAFLGDHLLPSLALYEAVLAGLTSIESTLGAGRTTARRRLLGTAWSRFWLWQTLCAMVGRVPPEVVDRMIAADNRFKSETQAGDELMDADAARELPKVPNPKQQFWYFYRCSPPVSWDVLPDKFSPEWDYRP